MLTAKVTLTLEVDSKALKVLGHTPEELLDALKVENHDIIDGIELFADFPGGDITGDFYISNGKIISAEYIKEG